jgi:hypothetical protein
VWDEFFRCLGGLALVWLVDLETVCGGRENEHEASEAVGDGGG